jgi:hypothetical protein
VLDLEHCQRIEAQVAEPLLSVELARGEPRRPRQHLEQARDLSPLGKVRLCTCLERRKGQNALRQEVQAPRPVEIPAGTAAHLAAGRLGQAERAEEAYHVSLDLVLFCDGPTDLGQESAHVKRCLAALDLLKHHQPLLPGDGYPKSGTLSAAQGRRALLHGLFNVMRMEAAAADDDQILEPAAREQLTLLEKTKVARAEEGPTAIGERSLEGFPGFLR